MTFFLLWLLLVMPVITQAQSEPMSAPFDTAQFIDRACISYSTSHTLAVESLLWERIIAHPYLFGKLWEQYGFEPKYVFHRIGDTIHVIDPTGIDAYLSRVSADDSTRVILTDGRMHGWGLPIAIKGRVLFVLTYNTGTDSVSTRFRLYGEGTGTAADLVIRTFSPLLKYLTNRRIVSNLNDAATIIGDLATNPQAVRAKLPRVLYEEFDRFMSFSPPSRP